MKSNHRFIGPIEIGRLSRVKPDDIRKEEVLAIRSRFPNKIPVIIQKYPKDTRLPHLDKSKYLVPCDIPMSQFQALIRKRMKMTSSQSLYFLVNGRSMISLSLTVGQVYSEHAGQNGFLYITYASQEAFGYLNLINENHHKLIDYDNNNLIC